MLIEESRIRLPEVPASLQGRPVAAWQDPLVIDTYDVEPPEPFPAYLDRRVYQGSSGRVYPLPFVERVASVKKPRAWQAVHLENEFVRLVVLPELGGRIHIGLDKTTGYDFFYRNNVIKPAMVGLAGPWVSGGVEFNWPQHHRPATYLPVSWQVEYEEDGSATVWCADHDPLQRMRAIHGVRLSPGSSLVELKVRLINRTDDVQTFLWWANVAARAGEDYQSFFPPDVHRVADHARRATTGFPRADSDYYGIDYPARVSEQTPEADRIDWYRNIPVPTSYMCIGSRFDFFGGYDHKADAGFVHWADHRVSPGKKQWTWGNSRFGWAWDRNLTDGDGPYVELMAGVFTDNQPDFSYLSPGETKTFSQYWYPIQGTGPVQQATRQAALSLERSGDDLGLAVVATSPRRAAVVVSVSGRPVNTTEVEIGPGRPARFSVGLPAGAADESVVVAVLDGEEELLRFDGSFPAAGEVEAATEPPQPWQVDNADELHQIGVHLAQYRHATRKPEPYWLAILERDQGDLRANTALGALAHRRGQLDKARAHLETALRRATRWNDNPAHGETHYRYGLVLAELGDLAAADDAFAKACWNAEWRVPAGLQLARLNLRRGLPLSALQQAVEVGELDGRNLQAVALRAIALRRLGREQEASALVEQARRTDPLDWWLADLAGADLDTDAGTLIDIALEYASIGDRTAAARVLRAAIARDAALPIQELGAQRPLAWLHLADQLLAGGDVAGADQALAEAKSVPSRGCFPWRLADGLALQRITAAYPLAQVPAALLGHWLYAKDRHLDAVEQWRRAPDDAVAVRNLGLASYNVLRDPVAAVASYERALSLFADSPRLWFERDQLAKRLKESPAQRLARLQSRLDMVGRRDDLAVEYAALLLATGQPGAAEEFMTGRVFQPWEGGEGTALRVWERVQQQLARAALAAGDQSAAELHLGRAWLPPATLGEDRHPLANTAELLLLSGDVQLAGGDREAATASWQAAAESRGDFLDMAVAAVSTRAHSSLMALQRLGHDPQAREAAEQVLAAADELAAGPATIDYFATSLPNLLLFDEDLDARNKVTATVIAAQVRTALGQREEASRLLAAALASDPNEPDAIDLAVRLGAE